MAKITQENILRTADLMRIALTEEEVAKYSEDLTNLLKSVEKINEINTDDVQATTNGNQIKNVLRQDKPNVWAEREKAIDNAPETEDGQIKVPAIMD